MYKEIDGFYGGSHTPSIIYIDKMSGAYCVDGGTMVNFCNPEYLVEGVDVEELEDYDCFTSFEPIESLCEFSDHVEEFTNG